MDRQNILQCQYHLDIDDKNEIMFICLNEKLPEGVNRLLCKYCLEDANTQSLIIVTVDRLLKNNRFIPFWPPLHLNLSQTQINKNMSPSLTIEKIEEFYRNLKENIFQIIDQQKKKDIKLFNEKTEQNSILGLYNEISGFSELQKIIESNYEDTNITKQKLEDFIKLKYSEINKNQEFMDQVFNKTIKQQENSRLDQIKEDIMKQLSSLSFLTQEDSFGSFIFKMQQSTQRESSLIQILQGRNKIQLIPKQVVTGQVYSDTPLLADKIYQFIIQFNKKPQNYICIGFEEESQKNRFLGCEGKNSFIIGSENTMFCSQLVKGERNLQNKCTYQFVDKLIIQVKISENKFYIADYPEKECVNCMNQEYKFKQNLKHYLTIQIKGQDTQIDILSGDIIDRFTLV